MHKFSEGEKFFEWLVLPKRIRFFTLLQPWFPCGRVEQGGAAWERATAPAQVLFKC